jgi:hypothetical protein
MHGQPRGRVPLSLSPAQQSSQAGAAHARRHRVLMQQLGIQ